MCYEKGREFGKVRLYKGVLMIGIIGLVMLGVLLMSLRAGVIGLSGLRWMMTGKTFIP